MTGAELAAPRPRALGQRRRRSGTLAIPLPGAVLGLALALLLFAAFDHGAVGEAGSARVEVAAAAIALVAAAGWLWGGVIELRAPRAARLALGLLAAFAVWNAVTLAWSVDPDGTWLEFNRACMYVVVLAVGLACGASWARAGETLALGLLGIGSLVAIYALGQKVLPGIHIAGVVDLNQTGSLPRLQQPLGYWNALALLLALAAPVALLVAGDPTRGARPRAAALAALQLMLVAIGFTYSRGGVLTLVVALALALGLGGRPLRGAMWLAIAVLGSLPALVVGLTSRRLTAENVPLGSRESAGLILLGLLVLGLGASFVVGRRIRSLEARVDLPPEARRRIGRSLATGALVVVVLGVMAVAVSHRGLGGTISHAWNSFTTTHAASVTQPGRLLSADSANRWVWWKEAAGAFSDRPFGGWGAGSFPVVHLLYRQDTLSVNQPHSVPLQWLAETGLVGASLAVGALVLLLAAGIRATRVAAPDRRVYVVALLAAAGGYAVHCLYDWDWDIPAVTLPVILALGVLAGSVPAGRRRRERGLNRVDAPRAHPIGLVVATVLLCAVALSAALPSIAATRAADAISTAAAGGPSDLARAAAAARLAAKLDPLSDLGQRVEATIALRQGQPRVARGFLLDAVRRVPSDTQAWGDLAYVEIALGDAAGGRRAAQRALALDPLGTFTASLAGAVASSGALHATPPQASATAVNAP